jgi:hypothetical protein
MHVPRAARAVALLCLLAVTLQQALVARWRGGGADVAAPGEAAPGEAAETVLRAAGAGAKPPGEAAKTVQWAASAGAKPPRLEPGEQQQAAPVQETVAAARDAGAGAAAEDPEAWSERFTSRASPRVEAGEEQPGAPVQESVADTEAWPDRFTWRASPRSELGMVGRARRAPGDSRGVVVNLGLPKSGTMSLHELLTHNYSLPSAHYNCHSRRTPQEVRRIVAAFLGRFQAKLGSSACGGDACAVRFNALQWHDELQERAGARGAALLPLAFAPGMSALTEINCFSPQAAFAPQVTGLVRLLTAYVPGELVLVLTSREDREWANSVRRWHGMGRRILLSLQGRWFEDHVFPDIAQDLMNVGESSQEGNAMLEAWLVELKRWHEGRVRALVAQSGHDLIELVVGSPQPRGLVENLTRLALLLQLDPAGVGAYARLNANPRLDKGRPRLASEAQHRDGAEHRDDSR